MFRPFLLALCVLAGLLLFGLLPEWGVGEWRSKPVQLLADLAPRDLSKGNADSATVPVSKDSCKSGVACIADYAMDSITNMAFFYAALNDAAVRPVRIAFVGDSFVEADILTDALRDLLQQRFGGCGVGYVTIDHVAVAGRKTIHQKRSGFSMHSAVDKHFDVSLPDLSGYYFLSQDAASVELAGNGDYSPRLAKADVSQFLLLSNGTPISLTASTSEGKMQQFTTSAQSGLQAVIFESPMHNVRWSLSGASGAVCYAVTMDGKTGVTVDNLSLRGSTGLTIPAIPHERLVQLDAVRHYDLVILQYGLNVMSRGKRDYTAYRDQVVRMIQHLRAAMPRTAFLVVGIADRGGKLPTGEVGTMPEVTPLLEAQSQAAAMAGAAFWNTFEAMGGQGAMVEFANAKPPLAARDYTHINEEGGQRIARLLFDALTWGYEMNQKKNS